jgi:hypothetical protein
VFRLIHKVTFVECIRFVKPRSYGPPAVLAVMAVFGSRYSFPTEVDQVILSPNHRESQRITENQYHDHMTEMADISEKRREIADYLMQITNWQLYQVIARGNVVYEIKSDNIVEGVFSWCKEERALDSACFFTQAMFMSNAERLIDLKATAIKAEVSKAQITPFAYNNFNHTLQQTRPAYHTLLI